MIGGQGQTVLVVDDEHAIVEALGELLAWDGFGVRTASNGHEALAALRDGPVDLVILDVMMPGLDGLRTVDALAADPALRTIPVILMSAAPLPVRERPPWAAALQKPFDLGTLRAAVARVLAGVGRPR